MASANAPAPERSTTTLGAAGSGPRSSTTSTQTARARRRTVSTCATRVMWERPHTADLAKDAQRRRRSAHPEAGNGDTALEWSHQRTTDASWGHRSAISTRKGGGSYGYKVHAVVDVATGLPVAWEVKTARDAESPVVPDLLDLVRSRVGSTLRLRSSTAATT